MANNLTGLDHAVVAVRDLDAASGVFERLGFALTPVGHHAEWGTANRCAMFAGDYVELIAPEGEGEVADQLRDFLTRQEGLFSLSLGSSDGAATSQSLRSAGLEVPVARSLSRKLDDGKGTTLMFSEMPLPPVATPGIPTRVVQHITAERERHPQWLDHPNTACGIAAATAIVEEPPALTPAWDVLFGPHSAVLTDDTVTVHTGGGLIYLTRPDELTQLHPEAELDELPPSPALVALAIRVADTDRAAQVLKDKGVDFSRDREGTVRIPPSEACGVFIEMVGA
ncbi:VOC family protein [Magnetospirillum aberrantis]|uniref:VOC family protein n=1 Tax=Magnetospirillum aberrantis SpK TaxID=908842 RepID=A0A7C9UX06_9PROT|nr:VOC family protein [Magnetospirillum aberrantis]NFV80750.1 VOC family protein [Magnetospirillum aberrantis SpK]